MKIELELTPEEVRKLRDACDHLAEEAHDDGNAVGTIWESEEWWQELSDRLEECLRGHNEKLYDWEEVKLKHNVYSVIGELIYQSDVSPLDSPEFMAKWVEEVKSAEKNLKDKNESQSRSA